jgi:zinc protease
MTRFTLSARLTRALAAAALVLAFAVGPPAVRAQPAAQVVAPRIDYHLRVLPNGLKVFSVLDKTTPNVTVQVWYGVGAKDDPAGRSGFAHLFEHLMFKGSRDMPPEFLDRLTEDVGGFNNASTDNDYTEFHEVIPANHLERLLWAEAERMSSLVVDQANFVSERAVVEEELRQRVLADPYGRLWSLYLPEASFSTHPYHRPPIGSIADLDTATLDDVRAFHAVYYRPDNANLIVIGNFDPAQLDAWVDHYFGPIAKPDAPLPRVTAVEPRRTAARTVDTYGPNVPLPAVVLSFQAPDAASPDAAALKVLDAVLTTGKSSRLYQSLVYRQQLADSVFSEPDLRQQGGLFAVGAVMAAGKSTDEGQAALRVELQRLRDQPVTPAELTAAKNQLLASVLEERETIDGRAADLGEAILVEGDPARVNSDVTDIEAVTAQDVQRVARLYLIDDRAVTIRYRPESERPAGQPDVLVQDSPEVAAKPLAAPAWAPVATALPPDQRQPPPPPSAAVAAVAPQPVERTLANGLRVIVAHTSDLPMVTARLTVENGAAMDPPDLAGLSNVTASLATQGAAGRSATDIAVDVEALGDSLSAGAGYDSSAVTLSGLATSLGDGLPILADVVRRPIFAQTELDRLRKQQLDDLSVATQEPGALAAMAMAPVVFASGPYGHPEEGSPQSLARITREAVIRQYEALYRPDDAILVLTGDIDPEQGFALAQRAFGDWPRPATAPPKPAPTTPAAAGRVVVIDLPGTGQAAVAIGARSIPRRDPAHYAADVANAVLGGGYSARLNEEVRVKRGLSYGAGSKLSQRRDAGLFTAAAQTRNDAADQVVGLMLGEIANLGATAAPPAELEARKAALVGDFGRTAATSAGLAELLGNDAVEGVDAAELGRRVASIEAVDAEQARAAAIKVADPAATDVVVAGDAKLFLPALRARFGQVQVVPADGLDFDTLRQAPPAR